jgi:hypothetical protein
MAHKILYKTYVRWFSYIVLALVLLVALVFAIAYVKREQIKQGVIVSLNSHISGTITVEKVQFTIAHKFPDFSISLRNVTLRDTVGKRPVLQAERIFLDVGFYALFQNEIQMNEVSIENADVFLYRGIDGYSNLSVFNRPKPDSAKTAGDQKSYALDLKDLSFKNVVFNYVDSARKKNIAFTFENTFHSLSLSENLADIFTTGRIECRELTFNSDAGGFLKGQTFNANFQLQYDKAMQVLRLMPSMLELKDDRITIDGEFRLGSTANFFLHIQSDDLLLLHGLQYVNNRIKARLDQFSVDRPVNLDVKLRGKLARGNQPEADVSFVVEKANVGYQKLHLQDVACSGQYFHRPDSASLKDENSTVVIKEFKTTLEGVPFEGRVTLSKLYDPVMELRTRTKITASMLNKLVDTTEWVSRSGSFTTFVKYNGRLEEYLDSQAPKYNGKLSGNFLATRGVFEYKPKRYRFENVNGWCHFSEKQFTIDSLLLTVNGNSLKIKGTMKNYIPFFIQPANKGYVSLDITTPRLDLSFIASETKARKTRMTRQFGFPQQKKITSLLNTLQRKLQFDVSVSAAEFLFRKFNAQNVSGQVKLEGNVLEATNVKMTVAGGEMATRLFFRNDEGNRKYLAVNTQVKDANIRDFFTMFSDFHQQTISGKNLDGSISTVANFTAEVFPNYSIDPESMKGNISCTIRDGRLIDFEPLANLSNFLFKKRDFSDVHFGELESYFDINGTNIDIQRMEVQSSVLSFFIQGRYSFKDTTSMSLQLPLSNLKKRDKHFSPENVGTDAKHGMSVYIHVFRDKDINSKIKFSYDPFKKWAKNGKAKE